MIFIYYYNIFTLINTLHTLIYYVHQWRAEGLNFLTQLHRLFKGGDATLCSLWRRITR